ncbi:RNA polymerase sigma-70 factor [Marinifilum sp. D737]|uniref:RNA polymerase sigma-70 factor n=1 Tax=Marinifilum sp. D737 TaxID=2969628 RepID=UPI002275B010|nr:RNA polymerase sigma-70 factor [Marinifilum sp. D737]MCY1635997.1 RNA polymerase sigma-70 factor [Marinifilum sp. D737]
MKRKTKEFRQFFESFYPMLCLFAQKYVQDSDVAADMVQESFIKLWKGKDDFKNQNAVKAFLYTVTRNNCLNYLKHNKIVLDYSLQAMEKDLFYRDHIIEQETYKAIHDAIEVLPSQGKRVVEMSMRGIKNPEIAERLSISVNTVKSVKANAYRLLRLRLQDVVVILMILVSL